MDEVIGMLREDAYFAEHVIEEVCMFWRIVCAFNERGQSAGSGLVLQLFGCGFLLLPTVLRFVLQRIAEAIRDYARRS